MHGQQHTTTVTVRKDQPANTIFSMSFFTSPVVHRSALRGCLAILMAFIVWGCNADTNVQTAIDSTGTGRGSDTTTAPSDAPTAPPSQEFPDTTGTPSSNGTSSPTTSANIRVSSPQPNATVPTGEFKLAGTARAFENSISYRVRDTEGNAIAGGNIVATGDMGNFNPYETKIRIRASYTGKAVLEVYQNSAKDGSEIDLVRVPIMVSGSAAVAEEMPVKIFLTNPQQEGGKDCRAVYPIQRMIGKTTNTAEAALRQLLEGPNPFEQSHGYSSEIPAGTRLNRISITNGNAHADFDGALNTAAGSCRVTAIRAQIEQTLRQFGTVQTVTISVNGDAKTALQP